MSEAKVGKILLDLDIPTFRKTLVEEGQLSRKVIEDMVAEEKKTFSELFIHMVEKKSERRCCAKDFRVYRRRLSKEFKVYNGDKMFLASFRNTISGIARLCTIVDNDSEKVRILVNNYRHGFTVSILESPSEETKVKEIYFFEPIGRKTYNAFKKIGVEER